jgi:hypothetical protein
MRIYNTQVFGLERALHTAGYAMMAFKPQECDSWEAGPNLIERGRRLGSMPIGSGHDHYLCGIRVLADWEAPGYVWPQIERYRFLDIVTSQSKMHRLTRFLTMDNPRLCFTPQTDQRAIDLAKEYLEKYNVKPTNENFEALLANTPHGIELVAGISTNYLALKTMYSQRRSHRLSWWNTVFVQWCNELPMFLELTGLGEARMNESGLRAELRQWRERVEVAEARIRRLEVENNLLRQHLTTAGLALEEAERELAELKRIRDNATQ